MLTTIAAPVLMYRNCLKLGQLWLLSLVLYEHEISQEVKNVDLNMKLEFCEDRLLFKLFKTGGFAPHVCNLLNDTK